MIWSDWKSNCHSKRTWVWAVWSTVVIVGPFFKFTIVKMKGPNKQSNNKYLIEIYSFRVYRRHSLNTNLWFFVWSSIQLSSIGQFLGHLLKAWNFQKSKNSSSPFSFLLNELPYGHLLSKNSKAVISDPLG